MSILLATDVRKPRRQALTLETVLTVIALTLWLVVLPLEFVS